MRGSTRGAAPGSYGLGTPVRKSPGTKVPYKYSEVWAALSRGRQTLRWAGGAVKVFHTACSIKFLHRGPRCVDVSCERPSQIDAKSSEGDPGRRTCVFVADVGVVMPVPLFIRTPSRSRLWSYSVVSSMVPCGLKKCLC